MNSSISSIFKIALTLSFLLFLASCSLKVNSSLSKTYPATKASEPVKIYQLQEPVPQRAEVLGEIRIGDSGFTLKCDYETVMETAKEQVRQAGGNAFKITSHQRPSRLNSCHQLTAKVLYVDPEQLYSPVALQQTKEPRPESGTSPNKEQADNGQNFPQNPLAKDYAILHIYRYGVVNPQLTYDLYLGERKLAHIDSKFKTTVRVKEEGLHILWAKTEIKTTLPIKLKAGEEYYIRCSVDKGIFVGHPQLKLMNPQQGKKDFKGLNMAQMMAQEEETIKSAYYDTNQPFYFALNGGLSWHLASVEGISDPIIREFVSDLMSGYHLGGNMLYFPEESLGVGIHANLFHSTNSLENVTFQDMFGNSRFGTLSEQLNILYVGPVVTTRLWNQKKEQALYINFSVGYMGYRDFMHIEEDYLFTGETIGISTSYSYDFRISQNALLALQFKLISGTLNQLNIEHKSNNQQLNLSEPTGLHRFEFSVGYRFYK